MQIKEPYIRNMVSSRGIVALRQMLRAPDLQEAEPISLGRVVVGFGYDRQLAYFIDALPSIGFALV